MNKLNIFSKEGLQKNSLSQYIGGQEGYESNTSECTWTHYPAMGPNEPPYTDMDSDKDGDWVSAC